MKSATNFALDVKRLALAHNEHFQAISEDGVIDYGEALNTRELLHSYHLNLQELKRQIGEAIDNLQTLYSEKILVAQQSYAGRERAQQMQKLRQEEQQSVAQYESIIKRIEFLQVGIPQNQGLIENHITELETEMNQTLVSFQDITFDPVSFDPPDPIKEVLLRVLSNWHAIQNNINERQNQPQTPQQKAYDTGVERMLETAIHDIEDIVKLLD